MKASQFATDSSYILFYVLPDGVGSSPIKQNVFGTTQELFRGIAGHLFCSGRTDDRAAKQFDSRISDGKSVGDVVAYLSALVIISPQANLAEIHLNANAKMPLSVQEAQRIAVCWEVVSYS